MGQEKPKRFEEIGGHESRRLQEDVVELSFLLQKSQATALETEAERRGLTPGELIRCLIRDFFLSQTVFARN